MAEPPQSSQPPRPPQPEPSGPDAGQPDAVRPVWLDRHLWQIQPVRDILAILVVVGLFWLGSKLSIVTVPLLLAILFAYLLEPVIQWLMRRTGMQRRGAVSAILASFVLLVVIPSALGLTYGLIQGVGLIGSASTQVRLLVRSVNAEQQVAAMNADIAEADEMQLAIAQGAGPPDADPMVIAARRNATVAARAAAEPVRQDLHDELLARAGPSWIKLRDFLLRGEDDELLRFLETVSAAMQARAGEMTQAAADVGVNAATAFLRFAARAIGLAFAAFLTAFFFFFVATEWVKVQHFATNLIPERNKERTLQLAAKFDRAINGFVRGRLTIAFIQAIIFSVGYFIIGVPAAFILGPAVALLAIVPYLALIGVPISIALLWLENHTGLRGHILWVVAAPTAIYFLGQFLDDYVLTPAIQGKSTDMSTPAILFASLAGGALFGVFGLLIAIPIAACLKIVIQEILWPRFRAWAEGRSKDFLPISD